ncbi:molybdopterin-dependent oxidoreductase, partial [Escherichia coli]|nr:molybdopterin-dependent oxidoreductase [Escherichia coli]
PPGYNTPRNHHPGLARFSKEREKKATYCGPHPGCTENRQSWALGLAPETGTDAASGPGKGHVMLRECPLDNPSQYFTDYVRRYTAMPRRVMLEEREGYYAAGRMVRAAVLVVPLARENNRMGKISSLNHRATLVRNEGSRSLT